MLVTDRYCATPQERDRDDGHDEYAHIEPFGDQVWTRLWGSDISRTSPPTSEIIPSPSPHPTGDQRMTCVEEMALMRRRCDTTRSSTG